MMTASCLCNRIPHSVIKMETPYTMLYGKEAGLSHIRTIGARAFVHIKDANKLDHTWWEGIWCAASARTRVTQSVSGSPRRVELSKAGTSSSSKHCRTCFPLPGGFRRYRVWKLQRLTSASTASTTNTLHAKILYRMCKGIPGAFEFDADDPLPVRTPGGFSPGGATPQELPS